MHPQGTEDAIMVTVSPIFPFRSTLECRITRSVPICFALAEMVLQGGEDWSEPPKNAGESRFTVGETLLRPDEASGEEAVRTEQPFTNLGQARCDPRLDRTGRILHGSLLSTTLDRELLGSLQRTQDAPFRSGPVDAQESSGEHRSSPRQCSRRVSPFAPR